MEFLLENILNLVGFLVGLAIGIMSFVGFRNTGSPTLFRLTIAFFSISIGFFVIWSGYMLEDYVIKSGSIDRGCLLYTSPSPRDLSTSRMPSSA